MLESYEPEVSDEPLYNVTLGMRVQLKKEWVDVSRKVIDVKCIAKVDGADAKEDATTVRLRPLTDHTLSQERHIYNNTGERTIRIHPRTRWKYNVKILFRNDIILCRCRSDHRNQIIKSSREIT